jgi:AraC-like DNA-binding protein
VWAKIFCASQVLFFLPYYLNLIIGEQQNFFFVSVTSLAIGVTITLFVLVMKPVILYGLKGVVMRNFAGDSVVYENMLAADIMEKPMNVAEVLKTGIAANRAETAPDKVDGEIYLSGQKLASVSKKLSEHILQNCTFLKKGFTASELAAEMNMQPYLLSAVINRVFKTNFNDFINGYRIEHAKTLIQNGEAKMLTLEALSEQCGFNNRNSFTIAFKKHAGQTPSDFIRKTGSSKN